MITCDNMILSDFITCWVDKDYSVLKQNDNESAWADIYKEYLQLTDNLPVLKAMMLIEEIKYRQNELMIIAGCMEVLPCLVDNENINHLRDPLVKILREKGYRFDFNIKDKTEYRKDLKRVATRAKKIIADIKELEQQLKHLQSDEGGEEYTRQDFTNDIICLSKFMGYHVDKDKCTVAEYVSMKNAIYHHNENMSNGIK